MKCSDVRTVHWHLIWKLPILVRRFTFQRNEFRIKHSKNWKKGHKNGKVSIGLFLVHQPPKIENNVSSNYTVCIQFWWLKLSINREKHKNMTRFISIFLIIFNEYFKWLHQKLIRKKCKINKSYDKCQKQTQQSDRIDWILFLENAQLKCKNASKWCWSVWLYMRAHFCYSDTLNSMRKKKTDSQYAKNNIGFYFD